MVSQKTRASVPPTLKWQKRKHASVYTLQPVVHTDKLSGVFPKGVQVCSLFLDTQNGEKGADGCDNGGKWNHAYHFRTRWYASVTSGMLIYSSRASSASMWPDSTSSVSDNRCASASLFINSCRVMTASAWQGR